MRVQATLGLRVIKQKEKHLVDRDVLAQRDLRVVDFVLLQG